MIRIVGQDITIDRATRCVTHAGNRRRFGKMAFRLVDAILLAGPRTSRELFDIVYGDRADGGPLGGHEGIEAMIWQLKSKFASIGIELHSDREHWGRTRYWAAAVSAPSRQVSKPASEEPRHRQRELTLT